VFEALEYAVHKMEMKPIEKTEFWEDLLKHDQGATVVKNLAIETEIDRERPSFWALHGYCILQGRLVVEIIMGYRTFVDHDNRDRYDKGIKAWKWFLRTTLS